MPTYVDLDVHLAQVLRRLGRLQLQEVALHRALRRRPPLLRLPRHPRHRQRRRLSGS